MMKINWENELKRLALVVTNRLGCIRCEIEFLCVPYPEDIGLDMPLTNIFQGKYRFTKPFKITMTCYTSDNQCIEVKIFDTNFEASEPDMQEITNACVNYLDTKKYVYLRLAMNSITQQYTIDRKLALDLKFEIDALVIQLIENRRTRKRDNEPYGEELATAVADLLSAGAVLAFRHQGYCGTGLEYANEKFYYKHFYEGSDEEIKSFSLKSIFIEWLKNQSDQSLARLEETDHWFWDNQVITKKRLLKFLTDAPLQIERKLEVDARNLEYEKNKPQYEIQHQLELKKQHDKWRRIIDESKKNDDSS